MEALSIREKVLCAAKLFLITGMVFGLITYVLVQLEFLFVPDELPTLTSYKMTERFDNFVNYFSNVPDKREALYVYSFILLFTAGFSLYAALKMLLNEKENLDSVLYWRRVCVLMTSIYTIDYILLMYTTGHLSSLFFLGLLAVDLGIRTTYLWMMDVYFKEETTQSDTKKFMP